MTTNCKTTVQIFKALCDENRVAIVQLLQSGEKCACHISEKLNISQSKLSYHMKILCDSGIVSSWYVGKWTHYQIDEAGSRAAIACLEQITHVNATKNEEVACATCHKQAV